MIFTYTRGLRPGRPNQKVSVRIDEDDVHIIHPGLLDRWEQRLPVTRIRDVRVSDYTVEIDVTRREGVATLILDGPDARVLQMQIARIQDFAETQNALVRELGYTEVEPEPEPRTDELRSGEYFLAVQGLAMIRSCLSNPSAGLPRVDEIRRIIEHYDDKPNSLLFPVTEFDVERGYARWAPHYDGPNLAIEREEPIVNAMLAPITPGVALDAACGTGRHAAALAQLGHSVIGVDATEAMLKIARSKVPGADFRLGKIEALPVEDASVDVLACALALEHVRSLQPVFREFARVLKPGGHAIISDMHPAWKSVGGVAAFPTDDGSPGVPFVAGYIHQVSDYIRAFMAAGFTMKACFEPTVDDETLSLFPSNRAFPEATSQAFLGLPLLVIWHLIR